MPAVLAMRYRRSLPTPTTLSGRANLQSGRFAVRVGAVSDGQSAPTAPDSGATIQPGAQVNGAEDAMPPSYPMYQAPAHSYGQSYMAPAPQAAPAPSSGPAFWVWILVGMGVMWLYSKIRELMNNPMVRMMSGMGKAGMGGTSGGQPDMKAMMDMVAQMQAGQGGSMPSGMHRSPPFGTSPSPFGSPTINTTASEVMPEPAKDEGSQFRAKRAGETDARDSDRAQDVNASKRQQQQASTGAAGGASDSPFFDAPGHSSQPSSQGGFFTDSKAPKQSEQQGTPEDNDAHLLQMAESMLDMVGTNPEFRKQFIPHLPEELRSEETWQWIKSNPEMRKNIALSMVPQMKQMYGENANIGNFASMPGIPGATGENMKSVRIHTGLSQAMETMKAQGLNPDELMSKLMQDPEMLTLMSKPNVQSAIWDMQKDPLASGKYMSDPDVAKVMIKMASLNPQMMPGNMGQADAQNSAAENGNDGQVSGWSNSSSNSSEGPGTGAGEPSSPLQNAAGGKAT